MLNNGCVPSESGQTMTTADFRFTRVMAEQAARARLTLDNDQLSLIARLDALGQQLLSAPGIAACRAPHSPSLLTRHGATAYHAPL